jgi:hypothetical protein
LKPTAKFSRRYATMGIPIRRVWRLPVRDDGDLGTPGIRGLKPTAKIRCRYATMGIPTRRCGGCPYVTRPIRGCPEFVG